MDQENTFFPNTFCIECIEKHFCTAMSLANEFGYLEENRPFIIGELGCAVFHCFSKYPDLANEMRDIRHHIQERNPSPIDWLSTYFKIDKILMDESKNGA